MKEFPIFQHIQQETNGDCGATVVAMAIGCNLRKTKNQLRSTMAKDGRIYYRLHQMAEILARHGIVLGLQLQAQGKVTSETGKGSIDFNLVDWPCIIGVASKIYAGKGHFVLWTGKEVFDPQKKEPTKLEDYDIEDIHPLNIYNDVEN